MIIINPPPIVERNSIELEKWCSTMMKTINTTKVKIANSEVGILSWKSLVPVTAQPKSTIISLAESTA